MGGDAMAALQAVAQCRTEGICLTVHDMMRCGSLSRIASHAAPLVYAPRPHELRDEKEEEEEEEEKTPFPLSPVQQMFFDLAPASFNTWNQSIVLRVKRTPFKAHDIDRALEAVVRRHLMLRARALRASQPQPANGAHGAADRKHHQKTTAAATTVATARRAWGATHRGEVCEKRRPAVLPRRRFTSLAHAAANMAAGASGAWTNRARPRCWAADVLQRGRAAPQLIALMAHCLAVQSGVVGRLSSLATSRARADRRPKAAGSRAPSAVNRPRAAAAAAAVVPCLVPTAERSMRAQHLAPSPALPEFARVPP
jgi:hypothetical protein